jgi:hypothetical protein
MRQKICAFVCLPEDGEVEVAMLKIILFLKTVRNLSNRPVVGRLWVACSLLRQWRNWVDDTGCNLFTYSTTKLQKNLALFPTAN